MTSWDDIEAVLRPIALEDGVEVYRAWCNVAWVPVESPYQRYTGVPEEDKFVMSWRSAGGMVAELRGQGEDYMDFYCSGGEGRVSDRVAAAMLSVGLRPVV